MVKRYFASEIKCIGSIGFQWNVCTMTYQKNLDTQSIICKLLNWKSTLQTAHVCFGGGRLSPWSHRWDSPSQRELHTPLYFLLWSFPFCTWRGIKWSFLKVTLGSVVLLILRNSLCYICLSVMKMSLAPQRISRVIHWWYIFSGSGPQYFVNIIKITMKNLHTIRSVPKFVI